jgi:hypothetical protein
MRVLGTQDRERTQNVIAWWTVITWAVYAASFPTYLAFSLTVGKVALFALAVAGLLGGVMALRNASGWRPTLYAAYGLMIVWSLIYWLGLIDKILFHEETKTMSQVFLRLSQMVSMSFSSAVQHGGMVGTLSTFYREILMPVLQVAAVIALLLWAGPRQPMSPNSTAETDGRKSVARGSP